MLTNTTKMKILFYIFFYFARYYINVNTYKKEEIKDGCYTEKEIVYNQKNIKLDYYYTDNIEDKKEKENNPT